VTDYTGKVHFTSTDPSAVLPADVTLTNGQGSFSATLFTAGSRSITATDTITSSITGTQALTVVDNPATHFKMSATPATSIAGAPTTVTVTALDANGNVARGYTGTVHLSSTAPNAVLPANATLTNGTGTFSVTFTTAGRYTVSANDLSNASTDPSATLPADGPLNAGQRTFYLICKTVGSQTVTATDTVNSALTATTGTVTITAH
jgi:hypothetical protein